MPFSLQRRRDLEYLVLGSQCLTELRDKILCITDYFIDQDYSDCPDAFDRKSMEKVRLWNNQVKILLVTSSSSSSLRALPGPLALPSSSSITHSTTTADILPVLTTASQWCLTSISVSVHPVVTLSTPPMKGHH